MIGHRVALRPRSFLETGDLALLLMRKHARPFVLLLPWVLVPALIAFVLDHAFKWEPEFVVLVQVILSGLTSGVYTLLCGDLMLQPMVSTRKIQGRFIRLVGRFVLIRLVGWIVGVVTLGLAYRFIVFTPESVLLERGGLRPTLARSGALIRAAVGRAALFGVAAFLLLCVGAGGAELFHMGIRELFGLRELPVGETLSWASLLGIALMQPYLATLRFLLYIDCRTRREGWDLQVQFGALVTAASSPLRHTQHAEAA
jgi:hypothetical protein